MDTLKAQASKAVNTVLPNGNSESKPRSSQTILITGASGFVAAHVLTAFLEAGYKARGTVRSEETAANVKKTHAKYSHSLSFAIVPDIRTKGAFDEAVKDVDGVVHTASPFVLSGVEPEKGLLIPAIEGTKNILLSISAHAPQVKRVVITSSFAAILDMHKGAWPGHTYSEEDWNPETYDGAKNADGGTAYCASKKLAEKAAFDYVKETNAPFSIATICPPMVYGPLEHNVTSTAKLNTSSADIYRLMNGSEKEVPQTSFYAWVDVRDVGEAHLKAYETDAAANQRFFVTGGTYSYQIICDILREKFPELKDRVPEGKPGSGLGADVYKVDNSKAKRVLDMPRFRSLEECIVDTAKSLLEVEKAEKANNNAGSSRD